MINEAGNRAFVGGEGRKNMRALRVIRGDMELSIMQRPGRCLSRKMIVRREQSSERIYTSVDACTVRRRRASREGKRVYL